MNASAIVPASVANRLEAALLSGRSTEQAMRDIVDICDSDPDAPWEVLSLLDQYYRRGRISDATFRAVNSQIQRLAVGGPAGRAATRASLRDGASANRGPAVPAAEHRPASYIATTAVASSDVTERSELPALPVSPVPPVPPRQFAAIAEQMFSDEPAVGWRDGDARPTEERLAPTHRAMAAGTVLSERYVLEAPIDYGTTDTVYRAIDHFRAEFPLDEQRVAVKFPVGADAHRRFFRAQPLAHPNIARVLECGRSGGIDFYTLEFQRGKLLRDLLKEMAEPLQRRHALHVVREVGAAVVYAHEHGLVHGALDPKNILITRDGAVRVLNFDASPAQQADARHDLHALACIAYESIAGKKPFPGHDAISARQAGLKPKRPPGLGSRQWRALKQGLAWSPGMKRLTVKEWLPRLELERAAARLPPLSHLMTQKAPRRVSPVMTSAVVTAAILALALAFTFMDVPRFLGKRKAPPTPVLVPDAAAATVPVLSATAGNVPESAQGNIQGNIQGNVQGNAHGSAQAIASPVRSESARAAEATHAVSERPGRIGFAAESMSVPPDAPAARIVVRRTAGTGGDVGFSWWTENGSARAGEDYISLGTKQMIIPDGEDSVTLFVPLVAPNAPGRSDFSVVLGQPTGGATLGGISRVTVNLTPRH